MWLGLQGVPDRPERHGPLPERRLHGAVQLGLPQLRRKVREQQLPRDLRPHRVHHGLSEAQRRQRSLQRDGVRTELSVQRASELQRDVHRCERRMQRDVSGGTETLLRHQHVHLRDWVLLGGRMPRRWGEHRTHLREQLLWHRVLFEQLHEVRERLLRSDLDRRPLRVVYHELRIHSVHTQVPRGLVCAMHGPRAMWYQPDL